MVLDGSWRAARPRAASDGSALPAPVVTTTAPPVLEGLAVQMGPTRTTTPMLAEPPAGVEAESTQKEGRLLAGIEAELP